MNSIFLVFFNVLYEEAANGGVLKALRKAFLEISQN